MISQSWFASGKLLITGEYLVLEGAKALAVPLKVGQYLSCRKTKENHLIWNAMKPDGVWFQAKFGLDKLKLLSSTNSILGKQLGQILKKVRSLNSDFLLGDGGFEVETILEFDPEYGFGSSSTLISNLSNWAGIDPYQLLEITFGGSGYDIACANSKQAIIYQLKDSSRIITPVDFDPPFKDQLYLVYLGNKKRSKDSIVDFKKKAGFTKKDILTIDQITSRIIATTDLPEFEKLLLEHEQLMSSVLSIPTVKSLHFPDHEGAVKSLGAWGGDFVLVTSHLERTEFANYIRNKEFDIFYPYSEIVVS